MKKLALAALLASVATAAYATDSMDATKHDALKAPAGSAKDAASGNVKDTAAGDKLGDKSPVANATDNLADVEKKELNNGSWVAAKNWQLGTEVKVSKDGKNWMAAPDGTHTFKDGKTITVKDGKVSKM